MDMNLMGVGRFMILYVVALTVYIIDFDFYAHLHYIGSSTAIVLLWQHKNSFT